MSRSITVAVSTLNQWSLDFGGNLRRIIASIEEAKKQGAKFRSGPELEITGYSCEDHFYESDTFLHSWEALGEILQHPSCQNILIDVGMPARHKNVAYNCRIAILNKKILMIRPKLHMCNDGNYREMRWFVGWKKLRTVEDHFLPRIIRNVTGQKTVPFGDSVLSLVDTCLGFETCEELWHCDSNHIPLGLDGVEIIVNSSCSHFELQKMEYLSHQLIQTATSKCGGVYLYSNARGCDGQRVYYNGGSMVAINGKVLANANQFGLGEMEVTIAKIDIEDVRTYRALLRSRCFSAAEAPSYPRVIVDDFALSSDEISLPTYTSIPWKFYTAEEEIEYACAGYLWDYLRRSGQAGFFVPLSGGIDSASVVCIVHCMCKMVVEAVENGDTHVLDEIRRIVNSSEYKPVDAKELCNRVLTTCYMGTNNSSSFTKQCAGDLANQIGSYHMGVGIDSAVTALLSIFSMATNMTPKFRVHGGSPRENLAMQNVQARVRMVVAYLFAQLMMWVRDRPGGLLVLATANVDESLRGYMTKYDCSSGDLNPIGGISKTDLKRFLLYVRTKHSIHALDNIMMSPPTAELEPLLDGKIMQTDESDMGLTYEELSVFGRLRKVDCCGPYSAFCKLLTLWQDKKTIVEIADKTKHFYRFYAINRHKMTVLTPSVHCVNYSPDDNRYDLRPFLYNVNWPWQFNCIDKLAAKLDKPSEKDLELDIIRSGSHKYVGK